MILKRKSVCLKFMAIASFIFLCLQLGMLWNIVVTRKSKDVEGNPDTKSNFKRHADIKTFTEICQKLKSKVVMVDQTILSKVLKNETSQHMECRHLCDKQAFVTFAMLHKDWEKSGSQILITLQSQESFHILEFQDSDPLAIPTFDNFLRKKVNTHILLYRSIWIHLVIMYQRQPDYIWHGPLTEDKMVSVLPGQVGMPDLAGIAFGGKNGHAYDNIETILVKMDGLRIYVPRYPEVLLNQIPTSVFIECDHTSAKLFYSKYVEDVSDEAIAFKNHATSLLKETKRILDDLGVEFWISSGTCLGWYRQCDIITYSHDVDIGIFIKNYDLRLMSTFQTAGMSLKHIFGKVDDSFELSFQKDGLKLDIFFFYEEEDYVWNGGTEARSGNKFKYIFPKFLLCWTEFLGLRVRVPCPTLPYIQANYGKNWSQPVESWNWKKSPPNVRENGKWSEHEQDLYVQVFSI